MIKVYRYLAYFLFPFLVVLIYFRSIVNKEDKKRFKEKIFSSHFRGHKNNNKKLVWFHVASIGEFLSILSLIKKMNNRDQNIDFLICSIICLRSPFWDSLAFYKMFWGVLRFSDILWDVLWFDLWDYLWFCKMFTVFLWFALICFEVLSESLFDILWLSEILLDVLWLSMICVDCLSEVLDDCIWLSKMF